MLWDGNMTEKLVQRVEEITMRLDQIITFLRIAFREEIRRIKGEAYSDPVSKRILELSDGTRNTQTLTEQVAIDTDVSEKTVKRRLSELHFNGLILQRKEGNEVYYIVSNLF